MTLNIIDISDYQNRIRIAGLGSNLHGGICKITESTSYVSPAFANQYEQLIQAKKLRGFYHFAGSSVNKRIGNPKSEADFFLNKIGGHIHDGVPMLDWEPYGYGMSIKSEPEWVLEFVNEFHTHSAVWPIIYMDFNHVTMWNNGALDLAKEVATHTALMVAGGPKYNNVQGFAPPAESTIHVPSYWHLFGTQYTSRGNLNGYFPIDLNAVYLTADQWNAYANPKGASPHPIPSPSPMHGKPVPAMIARGTEAYFGSISGPANSHGGVTSLEREYVKLIQQQLIHLGFVPGIRDINSAWADGIFDAPGEVPGTGPTSRAVASFQRAHMTGTKYFGQVWWDDWTKLASL